MANAVIEGRQGEAADISESDEEEMISDEENESPDMEEVVEQATEE